MASRDKTRTSTPALRPGPNGLPRGQVTEIQRGRMLTATVEAVEEVGYARLTVAQVIGRAKVSRKTFYDVFLDREDCFLAAFNEAIARMQAVSAEAYAQESSWRESTRTGLTALLAFLQAEPGLARLCIIEALGAGPRVLARRGEVLKQLESIVDLGRKTPGARAGRSKREPADITAEGIVGAVFAVLHTRVLESSDLSPTQMLAPENSIFSLSEVCAKSMIFAPGREESTASSTSPLTLVATKTISAPRPSVNSFNFAGTSTLRGSMA